MKNFLAYNHQRLEVAVKSVIGEGEGELGGEGVSEPYWDTWFSSIFAS